MKRTSSIAASCLVEYLDTINCQPPRVSALRAPSPDPAGSGETSTNPGTLELAGSWLADHAYGQLRRKAALPAIQTLRESASTKVVTSCRVIVPTQPAAISNAAM